MIQSREDSGRQQAVRTRLMRDAKSLDPQLRRYPVQSSVKPVTESAQVLHIVDDGKEHVEQLQETQSLIRQFPAAEQFDQVPEIVPPVEGNPPDGIIEHDSGGHEQFPESPRIDSDFGVLLEIVAAFVEKIHGVVGASVPVFVELPKVELPDAVATGAARGEIAARVGERET